MITVDKEEILKDVVSTEKINILMDSIEGLIEDVWDSYYREDIIQLWSRKIIDNYNVWCTASVQVAQGNNVFLKLTGSHLKEEDTWLRIIDLPGAYIQFDRYLYILPCTHKVDFSVAVEKDGAVVEISPPKTTKNYIKF